LTPWKENKDAIFKLFSEGRKGELKKEGVI